MANFGGVQGVIQASVQLLDGKGNDSRRWQLEVARGRWMAWGKCGGMEESKTNSFPSAL